MFEQAFKNIDDVLWKEAGCTTELDYTEQTSWLLFLIISTAWSRTKRPRRRLRQEVHPIIASPYRWDTWAAPKDASGKLDHNKALTGDDLREFVDRTPFPLPKASEQEGQRSRTRWNTRSAKFGEIKNKISSGYNLREIIDQIDAALSAHRRRSTSFRTCTKPKSRTWATRAAKRRVLHTASADPRDGAGHRAEDWRNDLRRRLRLGGFCASRSTTRPPRDRRRSENAPGAHLLRQGEKSLATSSRS